MNNERLAQQLLKHINPTTKKECKYFFRYRIETIKRFFKRNLAIFLFQYLIIIYIEVTQPALPMYPPIGIAFTAFYLMGTDIFLGLVMAGFCGYLLHTPITEISVFNFAADILGGYWGARLCQKVLSCDIRPFENWEETLSFIKINALITCVFSSSLRMLGLILEQFHWEHNIQGALIQPNNILFLYLDLWLSDMNAILVFSIFMLSWVSIFHTREKVRSAPIILFIVCSIICFLLTFRFSASDYLYYYLGFSISMACIWSLFCNRVIMSAIVFILSNVYFIIFVYQKNMFIKTLGIEAYTLVPLCLLFFIFFILWSRKKQ